MTDVMVVDVGTRACLVEVDDAVAAASLATWVRAAGLPAEEVVPAARTVLLDGVDPESVRELLPRWAACSVTRPAPCASRSATPAPTSPGSPTTGDARRRRSSTCTRRWSSLTFCGFAPASPTSPGCPPSGPCRAWSRRSPGGAGSVGLADTWCSVYPPPRPAGGC